MAAPTTRNISSLRSKRTKHSDRIDMIHDARANGLKSSTTQEATLAYCEREITRLDAEITEAERAYELDRTTKLDVLNALVRSGQAFTEGPGDDRGVVAQPPQPYNPSVPNLNRNAAGSDPWSQSRDAAGAFDRARAAIERAHVPESVRADHAREEATRIVEEHRSDPAVQEWAIAGSDPVYVSAFSLVLKYGPERAQLYLNDAERTAMRRAEECRSAMAEGVSTTGGFLVPIVIDPSVILTNSGAQSPWRQIATVKQIATQSWKGISSAGVTSEWAAEAAEAADASPTVAQPTITPVRYDAYLQASFELVQDTAIATEVGALIADSVERLQSAAFAVGTGVTQPTGVVTALAGITASRVNAQTNGSFGLVDLYAVQDALPARARGNASWVMHPKIATRVRRFGESVTGFGAAVWTDLQQGTDDNGSVPHLLGDPVYLSDSMSSNITSGSNSDTIVVGDFRRSFYIVDRIGTSIAYNPLVIGANRRPTGEVGWFCFGRVSSGVVDGGAALRMLVQP